MAVGFYVAKYVNKKSDMDLAAKGLGAKEWNNSLKTKLSLLPKKLFRIRMSRNFGMKMLTMTNLSTECLIHFFFQAEDGIRDLTVTGVQTCALPILAIDAGYGGQGLGMVELALVLDEMGRAAYPGPYFATALLAASAITASGQENQMARYLPDIAHGRTRATLSLIDDALAWTAAGVTMRAERCGDGFVLSGEKRFVPFA